MPWTAIDERQLEKRTVVAMGRAERAIAQWEVVAF
jgi:hypothetical protein